MKHFVVVCGYGCNIDSPLRPYLDRVHEFVQSQEISIQPVEMVILCGGSTQRTKFPRKTEARVMFDYLVPMTDNRLDFPARLGYLLEEDSYTTLDNIKNAAMRIRNFRAESQKAKITIFCEATRAANVIMLARHFFSGLVDSIDDITVETASWERADPFLQVKNLIYNKLAITYPCFGLAERERNKRITRSYQA